MYHKLQYISQGKTGEEHVSNIHRALKGGCRWVQLRMKNVSDPELLENAQRVRRLCDEYCAVFVLNDNPHIAKESHADGVHLGLTDMAVTGARKIVGEKMIIGGTANTFEQVLQRIGEKCDYVGVGPFRFTHTKQNLSPVLGAEGYRQICDQLAANNHNTPLYAIGGILPGDVTTLQGSGVYGIAVSGAISAATDPGAVIEQFNNHLYEKAYNSGKGI